MVVWSPGLWAQQNVRDCSLGESVRNVRKLAEFRSDSKRSDFVDVNVVFTDVTNFTF